MKPNKWDWIFLAALGIVLIGAALIHSGLAIMVFGFLVGAWAIAEGGIK